MSLKLPPPVPRARPSSLKVNASLPGFDEDYTITVPMAVLPSVEAAIDHIGRHCVDDKTLERDPLTVSDLQALSPVPEWLRMEYGALRLAKQRLGIPPDKFDIDYERVLDWESSEDGMSRCHRLDDVLFPIKVNSIRSRHSHSMPSLLLAAKTKDLDKGLLGCQIEDVFGPFHSDDMIRRNTWRSSVYLGGLHTFKLVSGNEVEVSPLYLILSYRI